MSDKGKEYRVVWRRKGSQQRTKIYQILKGANDFTSMVSDGMNTEIGPPTDLLYCYTETREVGDWI